MESCGFGKALNDDATKYILYEKKVLKIFVI